jgi:hypothetical protein
LKKAETRQKEAVTAKNLERVDAQKEKISGIANQLQA